MKRMMCNILLILIVSCGLYCTAQITTPNIGLILPPHGATNWDTQANGNFSTLDTVIGILQTPFQGAWNSAVIYSKGQQVLFGGNLYYSLANFNINNTPNASPLQWVQVTGGTTGSILCMGNGVVCDTGISRDSILGAGFFDFGNGTQNDVSGTIRAASLQGVFQPFNSTTAVFNTTGPIISSSCGGSVYPLIECGNLLYFSRQSGATRDHVFFIGNPAVPVFKMDRTNKFVGISSTVMGFTPSNDLSVAPDTAVSRLGVGIMGTGNGTQGDVSGTHKAAIFDAGTGWRVAGAAPSAHYLRGNGTNYVDGTVQVTDIPPGTNSQCLITSGGVAAWGGCNGQLVVQLTGTPSIVSTAVNANTTSTQVMQSACTSAPCYAAGALNSLNKTIDFEFSGGMSFVNTSESVALIVGLTTAEVTSGTGVAVALPFTPTNTGSAAFDIHFTCVVTTAGAGGSMTCATVTSLRDASGVVFSRFGTNVLSTDLTAAVTPSYGVQFGTASTANIGAPVFGILHIHN